MKRRFFLIITALFLFTLAGCGAGTAEPSDTLQTDAVAAAYRQVNTAEAVAIMEQEDDYILLDVRTPEEYNAGHIPGAICIPNESIGTENIPELPDKDQRILVYCRSGRRSKEAAQKLADLGYTDVVEFGGIIDWTGETVTEE